MIYLLFAFYWIKEYFKIWIYIYYLGIEYVILSKIQYNTIQYNTIQYYNTTIQLKIVNTKAKANVRNKFIKWTTSFDL